MESEGICRKIGQCLGMLWLDECTWCAAPTFMGWVELCPLPRTGKGEHWRMTFKILSLNISALTGCV